MKNLYNIEDLLVKQNSHWITPSGVKGIERDIFSSFCEEIVKSRLILTINGPRRSGKTFLMKQCVDWLVVEKKVPAKNICYFQFSTSLNQDNIITTISDLFLKKYSVGGETYIFLDEVQYVDFWQDQIKSLYDLSTNIKFIVSGSTSLFYRQKSKESLAGRIYKFNLGALNFHEYLRFKNIKEPSSDRSVFVANRIVYTTEFKKYLSIGQYPEIVANPEVDPKKYILDLADQIVNFDVPYLSAKIDRQLFLNIIKTLSFDLADEFSANNVAKMLESDRRVIGEYIKILQEINLFSVCYNAGFKSMRKKLSGSKKIYSLNSNLSLHINGFDISYLNDSRVYGKYFENYVYKRLFEKYGNVEYYRVDGKELDFVTANNSFEIKSGNTKKTDKYQTLSQKLHKELMFVSEEEVLLL